MDELTARLRVIVEHLHEVDVPFALIGGLAVGVRVEPRFTRDIDIAVAVPGDEGAESVAFQLVSRGYRILAELDQTSVHRLATLRFLPPGAIDEEAPIIVDILFASSGIESEVVAGASAFEIQPGLTVPVAAVEALIAMKVLSAGPGRRKDEVDLEALVRQGSPEQMERARHLVQLIQERGFSRGQDLGRRFNRMMRRYRPS